MKQIQKSKNLANFIRRRTAELVYKKKSSHIGSVYSCADIIAVLYSYYINPRFHKNSNIFILSKGHACLAVYTALEYLSIIKQEDLDTYGEDETLFMSHISHKVPTIPFSTGSLGHGLALGIGKALAFKKMNSQKRVFVLLGDGELQEGSIWESLMFIYHYKLNNITALIDFNNLQSFGTLDSTINYINLERKLISFGFYVKTINGHDHNKMKILFSKIKDLPQIYILKTIKGYPIDFMSNKFEWHYKSPNLEQLEAINKQLNLKS